LPFTNCNYTYAYYMNQNYCLRRIKGYPRKRFSISIFTKITLLIFFVACFSSTKAQLVQTYDFAGVTYNATLLGYEKPGIGILYRATNGGTYSFGTISCFGYSISAQLNSSQFYFKAEKPINSVVIKGQGTGSNRSVNNVQTSTTLSGTYTTIGYTSGNTNVAGGDCGLIPVTFTTPIPAGTFVRFAFSGGFHVTSIDFNFVPTGTPPTVVTNSVTCGQNTTIVSATVTPGTMPLASSGIIWSTSNTGLDINLTTKTVNTPSATAAFSNTATGLTPSTTYYFRAYVKDLAGNVHYGSMLSCSTLPPSIPVVTTTPAFNIYSYKASSGGTNIDSGGLAITQKGICWSTTPNPTVASSRTTEGPIGNNFTSLMRALVPCATYYVRAYAVNALGVGYGNEIQVQTSCPATPALIANPLALNFGNIPFNTSSTVFSYTLTGANLTPASGNITITPPAGYTVSTSATSGFTSSLVIPYNAAALVKTIFVKLATSAYGPFNGGIVHSGGGVAVAEADTVSLKGVIIPDPNITTNAGTDFWTGFGYQERMDQPAGDADETKMSLYISVPAGSTPAIVNVELPGIPGATGFPKQNLVVNPGSVVEVTGFPTGGASALNPTGLPDARLYYTGFSKRGIHIFSTNGVPVSVWMHTYAQNNSAAGAMLFPTNTWNNKYTVQAYGGYSNNSNPASYFFVVANEDNTPIWFKPSADIVDSSSASIFNDGHTAAQIKYAKNVEYGPIILNKGEVFNAMGFIQGSGSGIGAGKANGLDLTGSTVRTTCDKKIAVFGGNGRCLVNATTCSASSGSDHMIQQMFPSVAWGTRFLTVPTKTMEYNIFRINIDDITTQVKVNGTTQTNLINGLYYQVETTAPILITSDKPVNVTQFIVAGQCNTSKGGKGDGDPEMIILSPVQQAINSATVYSATIKKSSPSANGHYINVVIKQGGIASFRLDGLTTADTGRSQVGANATNCYDFGGTISIQNAFQPHPADPTYYYAKFRVTPGQAHRLYSDSSFNAIAYGMGSGESYGYNAGTNIKDLTKPLFVDNPYLPNNTNNTSCTNNPITLKAVLPYPPAQVDSIRWYMSNVMGASPQTDHTVYNPTSDSTFTSDGVAYYVYKNPVSYTFTTAGSYNITGVVGGTFATQCGSTTPLNFNLNIVDPGYADFNIQYNPCVDDTVRLTDASSGNGFSIAKWRWDFGDNTIDSIQNPKKKYATNSVYSIKLRAINSIGCYADTTKVLDMTSQLIAKFGKADTLCAASVVIFSDSSSNAGLSGAINKWYWDYGDGKKDTMTVSSNMTHTYTNAGKYYVTLKVETAAGCTATYLDSVIIRPNPVADFPPPAGVCLPGATSFTNTSSISDGTIANVTYAWTFGDGGTSTATNPSHTYPNTAPPTGGYNVVLTATSQYGCVGTKSAALTAVFTKPVASFTVANNTCLKDTIQFTDNSSGVNQTINNWHWIFGDNTTEVVQNPKHVYATYGTYPVRLAVVSDKGCVSDTSSPFNVKVNPLPSAAFVLPSACLTSGSVTFTDASNITPNDGTQDPFTHTWTFGDPASGAANTATTQNGQHTYTAPGSYTIIHQVTTANGCKDADTLTYTVTGSKPKADFNVTTSPLCSNKAVNIENATTIAIGTVTKIEVIWDDVNAPTSFDTYNNPTASQVFSHTYPDFQAPVTRSYTIRLKAYSGTTCLHDTTKVIVVNASPKTQFLAMNGICLGDSRLITQGSQTSSLTGNAFYSGNGITNINGQFNSVAAGAGTHQLQYLFVTNAGCRDSSQNNLTVWPAPTASFTIGTPRCEKNNVSFTSTSNPGTGTITGYQWSFGDGSPVVNATTSTPVQHIYNTANNYNVSLQVQTNNGCVSTVAQQPVTVNLLPLVDFTPPPSVCLPDGGALFADNSSITDGTQGSFSYYWTFGDGGISLQKDPLHRYTAVGPFNVKLRVTTSNGCIDSAIKVFNNIHPQPKASFVTDPVVGEVCLGDSIRFVSTSNGLDGTVTKWRWDLGDGSTDTTADFWHTYATAKNYSVSLHVFNSHGCVSDTVIKPVIVHGYPNLNAGPDVYMLQGSSVVLNPVVTGVNSSVQYLWTGPNLSNTTVKNPIASPLNDQEYIVKVTNGLGCSTEDTMWVRLYRPPVFPNAFSPNGDGINDTWEVTHLNTYSTAKVEVFDRYGKVVFASRGYNKSWDGTANGKPLPVGVYYYVIHLGVVPQPLTGWITLLR
jgi:gliding motility-associated-like protein